jgi:hypothetical protein
MFRIGNKMFDKKYMGKAFFVISLVGIGYGLSDPMVLISASLFAIASAIMLHND